MFHTRHADRPQRIVELLDALSDTPVTTETHAWFIGHTTERRRCSSCAWPRWYPTPS